MILLLLVSFAGIALLDVPKLIKSKEWKDLAVYSFFFIGAFTLCVLHTFGIDMPSPIKGIQYVIKDLLHMKYS